MNATVAPRVDAKETATLPHNSPNTAPPARVRMAAPGRDSPVIAT